MPSSHPPFLRGCECPLVLCPPHPAAGSHLPGCEPQEGGHQAPPTCSGSLVSSHPGCIHTATMKSRLWILFPPCPPARPQTGTSSLGGDEAETKPWGSPRGLPSPSEVYNTTTRSSRQDLPTPSSNLHCLLQEPSGGEQGTPEWRHRTLDQRQPEKPAGKESASSALAAV